MVADDLLRSFARVAQSPDPDLAVAALMIARVAYPKLDPTPYLHQLDALGRQAAERVEIRLRQVIAEPVFIQPHIHHPTNPPVGRWNVFPAASAFTVESTAPGTCMSKSSVSFQ